MKQIRYLIFILLFCVFPARVFIHWLPILGYPWIATGLVMLEYVCILLLLILSVNDKTISKKGKDYKWILALFVIYSLYIIYYVFINPAMPRKDMAQVPVSNFGMIQSMITTLFVMICATNFQQYLNVKTFIKVSAAFMTIVLLTYSLTSDMSMYLYQKTLSGSALDKFDLSEYGLISTLTMSEFVQMAFILNLFARDSWTRNEGLNKLIFWAAFIALLSMLLIYGQRGPVLWLAVTILFYYFAKGKIGKTLVVSAAAAVLIIVLFGDSILGVFSKYNITLLERFMNVSDDGGSGRFGSAESIYYSSFQQIMSGPFFGSNFRLITGVYIGYYPHNFVLEFLMTFGIVFTLPLLWLIWKGVKISYYAIKQDAALSVFCLLFINTYSYHLTSFTVVNDTKMWILLAMVLCIKPAMAREYLLYGKNKVINYSSSL